MFRKFWTNPGRVWEIAGHSPVGIHTLVGFVFDRWWKNEFGRPRMTGPVSCQSEWHRPKVDRAKHLDIKTFLQDILVTN